MCTWDQEQKMVKFLLTFPLFKMHQVLVINLSPLSFRGCRMNQLKHCVKSQNNEINMLNNIPTFNVRERIKCFKKTNTYEEWA